MKAVILQSPIAGGATVQLYHLGLLKKAYDLGVAKFKAWRGLP